MFAPPTAIDTYGSGLTIMCVYIRSYGYTIMCIASINNETIRNNQRDVTVKHTEMQHRQQNGAKYMYSESENRIIVFI